MKGKLVRPFTEVRTRNTRAFLLVTDASERLDVDMDELVETPTDLEKRGPGL